MYVYMYLLMKVGIYVCKYVFIDRIDGCKYVNNKQ